MNARQQKTLDAIFESPTRSDIRWSDIESLLASLGAKISEGKGSRVRVILNGVAATFHRPHPEPAKQGAVKSDREFLETTGVQP